MTELYYQVGIQTVSFNKDYAHIPNDLYPLETRIIEVKWDKGIAIPAIGLTMMPSNEWVKIPLDTVRASMKNRTSDERYLQTALGHQALTIVAKISNKNALTRMCSIFFLRNYY